MVRDDTIRTANYDIDRLLERYPDLKNDIDDIELAGRRIASQKGIDKLVIDFVNTIDKVIIINDIDTPVTWSFYINGKIILVNAEKLDTSREFFKKYIKIMNTLPPDFNKDQWRVFIKLLQPKIIDERGLK